MIKDTRAMQIENELESISEQINLLYEKQHELNVELRKYQEEYYSNLFKSLMLDKFEVLISINPHVGYHDDVITIWNITNRESKFQNFEVKETVFRVDDYEASTRIRNKTISFCELESLIENYDLYVLSNDTDLSMILNHIYNPKYDNFSIPNDIIDYLKQLSKFRSIHKDEY